MRKRDFCSGFPHAFPRRVSQRFRANIHATSRLTIEPDGGSSRLVEHASSISRRVSSPTQRPFSMTGRSCRTPVEHQIPGCQSSFSRAARGIR